MGRKGPVVVVGSLKKVLAVVSLLTPGLAISQDAGLAALLQKGPVVLVEEDARGRFAQSTAVIEIHAPPERVWAVLVAMERFEDFMPKVTTSEVTRHEGSSTFDVHLVYDLPGPDTDYTARISVDEAKLELTGTWLRDDLKGSSWTWRLEPREGGGTLLFHTVSVRNFSPLLQQVEDDQQTVTVGVNVSSALATVKAIKRRSEEGYARAR